MLIPVAKDTTLNVTEKLLWIEADEVEGWTKVYYEGGMVAHVGESFSTVMSAIEAAFTEVAWANSNEIPSYDDLEEFYAAKGIVIPPREDGESDTDYLNRITPKDGD